MELPDYGKRVDEFKEIATPSAVLSAGIGIILICCLVLGAKFVSDKSFGEPVAPTTQTVVK